MREKLYTPPMVFDWSIVYSTRGFMKDSTDSGEAESKELRVEMGITKGHRLLATEDNSSGHRQHSQLTRELTQNHVKGNLSRKLSNGSHYLSEHLWSKGICSFAPK